MKAWGLPPCEFFGPHRRERGVSTPRNTASPGRRGLQARRTIPPTTSTPIASLPPALGSDSLEPCTKSSTSPIAGPAKTSTASWKANIVAIATRHADAVDVRFEVNGRPMWIALPCTAWVEQKKRTGKVITDQLAAQIAGRYLKQIIEEGYDSRREIYTMTVPEVLDHLDAVVAEARALGNMPSLPVGIESLS